jgi:hypothetical protein
VRPPGPRQDPSPSRTLFSVDAAAAVEVGSPRRRASPFSTIALHCVLSSDVASTALEPSAGCAARARLTMKLGATADGRVIVSVLYPITCRFAQASRITA